MGECSICHVSAGTLDHLPFRQHFTTVPPLVCFRVSGHVRSLVRAPRMRARMEPAAVVASAVGSPWLATTITNSCLLQPYRRQRAAVGAADAAQRSARLWCLQWR